MSAVTAYLPTESDDATRQQATARVFYLLGDYFTGTDSVMRSEPGFSGGRVLGPNQTGVDVGVGNGGEVFQRGRSGQVATQGSMNAPAALPALLGNPLVLLALAVGAFVLLRRA